MVEVLVSTTILMLVVLFAAQLLAEAGRMLSNAQVEMAEPSTRLTTQWLRRDIQGASDLGRLSFAKTSRPLELEGHAEGRLRYERSGNELHRVILAPGGEEIGRRTMLRGVSDWRWRSVNPGLVELEIACLRRRPRFSVRRGGPPAEPVVLLEARRFALRGHQRRSW